MSAAGSEITISSTLNANSSQESSRQKRKRDRVILSCQACHLRKQQCDRGRPCQRCVKRGLADVCYYELPKEHGRLKDKLEHVERSATLEALLQLVRTSNPDITAAELQHVVNATPSMSRSTGLTSPDNSISSAPADLVATILHNIGRNARYIQDSSVYEIVTHFPDHGITSFLLDHYFETTNITNIWPVVHRPAFDRCYATFSSVGPRHQNPDSVALISIICAMSLQFLPDTEEDATLFSTYDAGRHVLRQRLHDWSRSILLTSQSMTSLSLEHIQGLVILSLYNANEGNVIESHTAAAQAIRAAQFIAMNRDGLSVWRMRPYASEIRRRLWWILYLIDRLQCLSLRRPYIIHDHHCDVAYPLNLSYADLQDEPSLNGKKKKISTEYSFHIVQAKLAQSIGRMWDKCYSLKVPTYQDIFDIEKELLRCRTEGTPDFIWIPFLQDTDYEIFHNNLLDLEMFHIRMLLLRPMYFGLPIKMQLLPEETSCLIIMFWSVACALCTTLCIRILSMLWLMIQTNPPNVLRWSFFIQQAFDSALSLAVAVVLDPRKEQACKFVDYIGLSVAVIEALPPSSLSRNVLRGVQTLHLRTQILTRPNRPRTPTPEPNLPDSMPYDCQDERPKHVIMAENGFTEGSSRLLHELIGNASGNPLWASFQASMYTGNFPGLEAMSSPQLPDALDAFLDTCAEVNGERALYAVEYDVPNTGVHEL